jgi:hypothetical protein
MIGRSEDMAMGKVAESRALSVDYEGDFNLWGLEQARLLREGRWSEADLENIAEELESLGRSQKTELRNRLAVLLQHLLKWHYQPDKRKYGWRSTIIEQRVSIETLIETSPSLKRYPAEIRDRMYKIARMKAADETGLPEQLFPEQCPYELTDALRSGFYPGPEEHDVV